MTVAQLLVVYGLVLATSCFVALYVHMSRIRSKLERLEITAQNAYDAGFHAGYKQASEEMNLNREE